MSADSPLLLTDAQQARARSQLLGFFWLNGIAVACVMENILLLWALQNGLSSPLVAVLSSFVFLSMPFMKLGKHLTSRLGLVRAYALCWKTRYVFILLMVPAPWLAGRVEPWVISAIIIGATFVFFSLRSMGMINSVPLFGMAAGSKNLGSFQARASARSHLSYLLTLILIIWVLRGRDRPGTYQWILTAGCAVGIFSASVLRRTPEPPGLRHGARVRLRDVARDVARNRTFLRLSLAWSASTMTIALIIPIAMLAVKQGYGVPDNTALGFTLVELIGAIAASVALAIIADHTGPRPIILLSMLLFLGVAGFWALAPRSFYPVPIGMAFLLAGISRSGLHHGLTHYLLATSSPANRFGVGLLMQMMSGVSSGIAGSLIGGGLLRFLPAHTGEGLALYHAYYRAMAVLVLLLFLVVSRLPRIRDWAIHDVIGLIFSFRDLRALITLNRLQKAGTDDEDTENLDRLSALQSRYSEPVLTEFLLAGRLVPRSRAIHALSRIPFGEAAAQALIREVREGAFTNGWRAAELLGQRRITEAIPALREGLRSEDPFLCGKCMVALARMGDAASYPAIRALFQASENPRILIHGAEALEIIRSPEDLPLLLAASVKREWTQPVLDEILLAAAALCGKKRQVYRRLRSAAEETSPPVRPPDPAQTFPPHPRSPLLYVLEFLGDHPWEPLPRRMRFVLSEILTS